MMLQTLHNTACSIKATDYTASHPVCIYIAIAKRSYAQANTCRSALQARTPLVLFISRLQGAPTEIVTAPIEY